MKQFEVGKTYEAALSDFTPITVLKRTSKCIVVKNNDEYVFRMVIKTDDNGDEYVRDSSVPERWREGFRYSACWEVK